MLAHRAGAKGHSTAVILGEESARFDQHARSLRATSAKAGKLRNRTLSGDEKVGAFSIVHCECTYITDDWLFKHCRALSAQYYAEDLVRNAENLLGELRLEKDVANAKFANKFKECTTLQHALNEV